MTLERYIKALGLTEGYFFLHAGVPATIARTVARGEPIAQSYAKKICAYLSQEFERPITIADVKDMKVC